MQKTGTKFIYEHIPIDVIKNDNGKLIVTY